MNPWRSKRVFVSVSVIIPTRNQHLVLDQAINSISRTKSQILVDTEIIVINNQSDEPESLRYLDDLPRTAATWGLGKVSVIEFNEPFNFSKMNNEAVKKADGDTLVFLNNDVEVISHDWLDQLVNEVTKTDVGCAGSLLFYPNETVQHAGVIMGMGTIAGHAYVGLPRNAVTEHPYFQQNRLCTALTGACLSIRREVFDHVGGFEQSLAVAFNDVDLCLKVQRAGYKNVFLPSVHLYHHESLSRGRIKKSTSAKKRHRQEIRYMQRIWGNAVLTDPYWLREAGQSPSNKNACIHITRRRWRKPQTTEFRHKDVA